ncbi:MAG: hypothetical protein AB8H79_23535 [Myxococcota bacterium]
MKTAMMVLATGALLLTTGGCKKKVEPPEPVVEAPPPPPEPPAPPPPPQCVERGDLQGSWFVTTQVGEGVGGKLAGVNGFYRLSVFKTAEGCRTKILVTKEGWGRGDLTQVQSLLGEVVTEVDDGWWHFGVDLTGSGDPTQLAFWLKQDGEKLEGFWHYTANSWTRSPVYGVLEGGREAIYRPVTAGDRIQAKLDQCGLEDEPMVMAGRCAR